MINNEIYEIWEPVSEHCTEMVLQKLTDTDEGLHLFLRCTISEKILCVQFDVHAAYRNLDESYRYRTIINQGTFCSSFYKVKNSKWLSWFDKESSSYYKNYQFIHYAVVTIADWVDVISEFPPKAYWLEN